MPPAPDDLKELGERIANAEQKRKPKADGPQAQSPAGIAFRVATEMFSGVLVGVGLGWCVDWAFDHWSHWQTRPWGIVVMFVVGAALGIRMVMRTAMEYEAQQRAARNKDRER